MVRTKTVIKYTHNLTEAEYKECWRKNMGSRGQMRDALEDYHGAKDKRSKVVLVKDENNRILAWSLVMPRGGSASKVMFWVVPEHRRRGYGTRLLKHSNKVSEKPYVYPWDDRSAGFFKKNLGEVKYESYDRFWFSS